jgi:hypothetical protein
VLVFLRLRFLATRLVHSLRRSLLTQPEAWDIDIDRHGRPTLCAGPIAIVVTASRVRLFDAVHLYCDGTEIWLPPLHRVRLRTAVRLFLLRYALENWQRQAQPRRRPARSRRRQPVPQM